MPGHEPQQILGRGADAERPQVARHVVADRDSLRLEVELQPAAEVQLPQVVAGFLRVLGDGERVFVVVEQDRVFVREREDGRRLGGDDRVTLADRFGQHGDVLRRRRRGPARARRRRSSACRLALDRGGRTRRRRCAASRRRALRPVACRSGWRTYRRSTRFFRRRFAADDAAAAWRLAAENCGGPTRQLAALGDAGHFLQQPAGLRIARSPSSRCRAAGRRARPAYRFASAASRAASGRWCSRTRPWLRASAWEYRRWPGIRGGTCGSGRTGRPLLCTHLAAACRRADCRTAGRERDSPSRAARLPRAGSCERSDTSARRATSCGTSPQPLQARAATAISSGVQTSCSSNSRGGWPFSVGAGAALRRHRAAANRTPDGRMCCVMRVGASGTILPGFSMPCGSKICFSSRNTLTSGPYCLARNGVRLRPSPCSPLIVPRSSQTFSYSSAASDSIVRTSSSDSPDRGTGECAVGLGRRGRRPTR